MDVINAALDSKLDLLAIRIETMVTTKFQNIQDEVTKLRDKMDESVNHVESVLKQDIDSVWEYAVRNEQYSRKNNLWVLGLEEDERENLEKICKKRFNLARLKSFIGLGRNRNEAAAIKLNNSLTKAR